MNDVGFVKVEGIKCDADLCDYENRSIPAHEYGLWVGRQCPQCGNVLLTENGFNMYKLLTAAISIGNKIDPDEVALPTETGKIYHVDIEK